MPGRARGGACGGARGTRPRGLNLQGRGCWNNKILMEKARDAGPWRGGDVTAGAKSEGSGLLKKQDIDREGQGCPAVEEG